MTLDETQLSIVLACVADALVSTIDPSGGALRRACGSLKDGIIIAEEMDATASPAASLLKKIVENLEEVNKA